MNLLLLSLFTIQAPADPDTARFAKWEKEIAGIEQKLKESPPKPGCVLFLGSSNIRLWDLKTFFPNAGYVNAGFGGSEIRDSTHFAPRVAIPLKPSTIVFYAGDNDIANNRKPEQVDEDFKAFCEVIHKDLPKCRVLFLSIRPSPARWKKLDEQKKANALVNKFCATDPRLTYLDMTPLMLGTDGMPIVELYVKDGLHLSPKGYELWSAKVREALK